MPMRQLVCFASAAVLAGAIFAGTMSDKAQAEEQWWPFKANDWVGDTATAVDYVPLSPDEVTKKWHLCVLVPHMKDSVWVSINYGHVREARRLGVQLTVFEAGGYPNLTRQLAQYDDCVALGVDAIVFSAISEEGLTRKVQEGREKGIVQVASANTVSERMPYDAASFPDNYTQGLVAGQYIAEFYKDQEAPIGLVDVPGPQGANWAESSAKGVEDGIAGSNVTILKKVWGDTGKSVQLKLVEDVLQAYPEVRVLVGNAVMNEVAPSALEEADISGVEVVGNYANTGSLALIKSGDVLGAPLQMMVPISSVAIDQAVRILEGKPFLKRVRPLAAMLTRFNVNDMDLESLEFGPADWKPVYSLE